VLKSLASYMAEFRKFKFDSLGSLEFDRDGENTTGIGSHYTENFGQCVRAASAIEDPTQHLIELQYYMGQYLADN
jgi:hypothetical protein